MVYKYKQNILEISEEVHFSEVVSFFSFSFSLFCLFCFFWVFFCFFVVVFFHFRSNTLF